MTVILEGMPAGLEVSAADVARDLRRRQRGHGRGGRQQIEADEGRIVSGVRGGVTIGSPITVAIENRDHANWTAEMAIGAEGFQPKPVTRLRPGHADLPGALKYGHADVRNVLERSSARETAARVAAGALAKALLTRFGVRILSYTQSIGPIEIGYADGRPLPDPADIESSPVRCPDSAASAEMVRAIDAAAAAGDTLGGTFRVVATGVVAGLGTHVHWDRKLDGRIAQAMVSINAVKGVEFGAGFAGVGRPGSQFHDRIEHGPDGFRHLTNRAGGITGGMTNGETVDVRVALKPISTMRSPLPSVDLLSGEAVPAHYERSDICVVPAAGVIGEAMLALVLADAFLEKFGGDSMREAERSFAAYCEQIRRSGATGP